MKLHEVLQAIKGDKTYYWFRPVSWKGRGEAFCLRCGTTYLVPTMQGPERHMTTNLRDLMDDWEILNPTLVLEERGDLAIS